MKFKSFTTKLAFTISIATIVIIGTIITYVTITSRNEAKRNSQNEMVLLAEKYALKIEAEIEVAMNAGNIMASSFASFKKGDSKIERKVANDLLKEVLLDNQELLGTYTLWEPNAFDNKDNEYKNTTGHDQTGRFIPYWTKNANDTLTLDALLDYTEEGIGDYYLIPKKTKKEAILEPFSYPINGVDVLLTSLVTPILIDNKFYGIAGADITIDFIQSYILNAKMEIDDGKIELEIIAHNGTYAANSVFPDRIGKNISDYYDNISEHLRKIQTGKKYIHSQNDTLTVNVPMTIGKTTTPWQVRVSVPNDVIVANANQLMKTMIILGILLIIISVSLISFIIARLSKPLIKLVDSTKQIANGNLSIEIQSKQTDEIGQLSNSFNMMVDKIREVVTNIRNNSESISTGSSQIATSSQTIAQGANEQAASTEQISASTEQMVTSICQNTENAQQAQKIAQQAEKGIIQGQETMEKSIAAMQEISKTIGIITEIAEKTDLLAINAAIEAARAGQFGKGFSVVAVEIRKLAENSHKAAEKITELSISGLEISKTSGDILKDIVPDVQKTSQIVQEITAASNEQNSGASQINSAVQQLNTVTQQNTATAEELASGAEELASQAVILTELVSYFVLNEKDKSIKMEEMEKQMQHLMDMMQTMKKETTNTKTTITEKKGNVKGADNHGISIDLQDRTNNKFEKY